MAGKKDGIGKKTLNTAKYWTVGGGGLGLTIADLLAKAGGYSGLFKDGGRVRGCGKAKRGFGKAMTRKR
jgi:hypothetical protein